MVRSRSYFSTPFLCGAARFARDALEIENAVSHNDSDTIIHRAFVVASVTSSAASLESMINEIFCDANEPDGSCIAGLSTDVRSKLATVWAIQKTSAYAILDKFALAHLLITGNAIDRSHDSWRDAKLLVRLRNYFVHFEPTWSVHNTLAAGLSHSNADNFGEALRGRFRENPLVGEGNAFFPDKLLGHGCAEWAVISALRFADKFWADISIGPHYEAYRQMFNPR